LSLYTSAVQTLLSHVPVAIHNIHIYQYHNTGYVHVPLSTASTNAYIQVTGLLACFAGRFQVPQLPLF